MIEDDYPYIWNPKNMKQWVLEYPGFFLETLFNGHGVCWGAGYNPYMEEHFWTWLVTLPLWFVGFGLFMVLVMPLILVGEALGWIK